MCGIAGIYNFTQHKPVDEQLLQRMCTSIKHRGPDDEGIYVNHKKGIGLAFRRLSIIDLESGNQPMSNPQGTIWIVFNGEIYNYPELTSELMAYGHKFRTKSDTEVILHGYEEWGVDILNRLNGMFGLAVWDEAKERLVLARDRVGMKPLYYRIDKGTLFFGSEIRVLLAGSITKPEIDIEGLNLFIRYQFTPSPYTLFKGIKRLPSGNHLIIENGNIVTKRWWDYKPIPFEPSPTEQQAEEELLRLYMQSVGRHLLSDVPVGLLLSGGVDSGLLLRLMNYYGKEWPTFSIGYGESFKDDELNEATRTAQEFGARHTSLRLNREQFELTLSKVVSVLEEPVSSASVVPMYHICERARQDVKVVLMGQGPDELLGGYKRHLGLFYGDLWRKMPSSIRYPFSKILNNLPRNEMIKRALYSLDIPDRLKRYEQVFSIISPNTVDTLFRDEFGKGYRRTLLDVWGECSPLMDKLDELGGFNFFELRYFLPDELLLYGDKLSMAHGLEVRVPYLDQMIIEYIEKLPAQFKIKRFTQKYLHRKVCINLLTKELINRRKKNFAGNVTDDWFREAISGRFDDLFQDVDSKMYSYLSYKQVHLLLTDHISGKGDNHKILYSLIVLEEWLRTYMD